MVKHSFSKKLCYFLMTRLELIKLMFFILFITCLSVSFAFFILKFESKKAVAKYVNHQQGQIRFQHDQMYAEVVRKCDPIFQENLQPQYYATIDGIKYPKLVPTFFNTSINFDCLNSNGATKTILIWNWEEFSYGIGKRQPFIMNKCPVVNCELTNDKDQLDRSDLVLVKYTSDLRPRDLPKLKRDKSTMSLYLPEPLVKYGNLSGVRILNGLFNSTATFKLNSNYLPHHYANVKFKWERNENFKMATSYFRFKTGLVAALVENCTSSRHFLKYIEKLNNFIPVALFGECGKWCDPKDSYRECRKMLYKKYKFVLLYEPQIKCSDYVTEAFFDAFLYDTILVVFNRYAYEDFVPKSAFVNGLDFKPANKLANYLRHLDANATASWEYLKWKMHIKQTNHVFKSFCDICIRLHLEGYAEKKSSILNNLDNILRCNFE